MKNSQIRKRIHKLLDHRGFFSHESCQMHRILKWFVLEGTNGLQKLRGSNPLTMGRNTSHWARSLKAQSSLVLKTPNNGASTASLGYLFQCFTTLIGKSSFPMAASGHSALSYHLPLCLESPSCKCPLGMERCYHLYKAFSCPEEEG